jgi:hypothetical protein
MEAEGVSGICQRGTKPIESKWLGSGVDDACPYAQPRLCFAYERASVRILARRGFLAWLFRGISDYMTQGRTLEDLKDHLKDLYRDLVSGEIPSVRRVAELEVA